MSLDRFTKPDKGKEDERGSKVPVAKPAPVKKNTTGKVAKKAQAREKAKPAFHDAEEAIEGDREAPATQDEGLGTGVEPDTPRESALKAMGLREFALTCPACKYKKGLRTSGEPKPHQLLCKRCGGQMKAVKK